MNIDNCLQLDLWKNENEIVVTAEITLSYSNIDTLTFYLAEDFVIDQIIYGGIELPAEIEEKQLPLRASTLKYTLALPNSMIGSSAVLLIKYHGAADSWYTLYEQDILAVNIYTAWYPDCCTPEIHPTKVRIHLNDEYFIINGSYQPAEGYWEYQPPDFDVNILALRNSSVYRSTSSVVYYYGTEHFEAAKKYISAYETAANYFKALYGNDKTHAMNLVILPNTRQCGAYIRTSLMVFDGFDEDTDSIVHHIAHETAHCWCTGALPSSWEDWMNETFAEWSALLFELEVTHNIAKFNEIIEGKQKACPSLPSIRTSDGKRPEGVHDHGVILLYEIYRKYGIESMKGILRAFDYLKIKSTQNLLIRLRQEASLADIADYINKAI